MTTDYTEPVSLLLALGDVHGAATVDYLALGLTAEHLPELMRMSLDEDLQWADSESAEVWAPFHAWRALGAIGDPAAIPTLIEVLRQSQELDDHWSSEEPPELLAMFGTLAIEPVGKFIAESQPGEWARWAGVSALEKIATAYPENKVRCCEILRDQLRNFDTLTRIFNAAVISTLADLGYVDAAPEMEAVFAADAADLSIAGDWEEIQIELGLLEERITPPPEDGWFLAEHKKSEARMAEIDRELKELRAKIQDNLPQIKYKVEQESVEQQRTKRKQARKQAKQTKKKQKAKKKKKRK